MVYIVRDYHPPHKLRKRLEPIVLEHKALTFDDY